MTTGGTDGDVDDAQVDPLAFGRALLAANLVDAGGLPQRMRTELVAATTAIDLALHLIDYRLMSLRPVGPPGGADLRRPEPVEGSPLGDCFRHQRMTYADAPAGRLCHVPVSVRGQRLGVLTGTFPGPPSPDEVQILRSVALAVAHSLLEASSGTDTYEITRRHGRMSVAAEMQWQLLPARAYQTSHFYVAGHLEPALRVAGDAFDFAVNDDVLVLAVVDASGTGGAPSLVTTLAVTAIRNARRSELPLNEQAALASDIMWQNTHGGEQVSTLFVELNAQTRRALAIDAGASSSAMVRLRAGDATPLQLEPQTPLGTFDEATYHAQAVDLQPGDRLYAFSDGAITEDRSVEQVAEWLAAAGGADRFPPPESIRLLVAELTDDGQEPEDDITVVCLDWA